MKNRMILRCSYHRQVLKDRLGSVQVAVDILQGTVTAG